jgi:hypothetical protein
MTVAICQSMLHNIPVEHRPDLHHSKSQKSHIVLSSFGLVTSSPE